LLAGAGGAGGAGVPRCFLPAAAVCSSLLAGAMVKISCRVRVTEICLSGTQRPFPKANDGFQNSACRRILDGGHKTETEGVLPRPNKNETGQAGGRLSETLRQRYEE